MVGLVALVVVFEEGVVGEVVEGEDCIFSLVCLRTEVLRIEMGFCCSEMSMRMDAGQIRCIY